MKRKAADNPWAHLGKIKLFSVLALLWGQRQNRQQKPNYFFLFSSSAAPTLCTTRSEADSEKTPETQSLKIIKSFSLAIISANRRWRQRRQSINLLPFTCVSAWGCSVTFGSSSLFFRDKTKKRAFATARDVFMPIYCLRALRLNLELFSFVLLRSAFKRFARGKRVENSRILNENFLSRVLTIAPPEKKDIFSRGESSSRHLTCSRHDEMWSSATARILASERSLGSIPKYVLVTATWVQCNLLVPAQLWGLQGCC